MLLTSPQPIRLECEHLRDPLGIDVPHPRLSWQLESKTKNIRQKTYTLTVSADSAGRHIQWQVKQQSAGQLVVYKGTALQPFTKYYWKVKVSDSKGHSASSTTASFETGPMRISDWQGDWITDQMNVNLKPAPYFQKEFKVNKAIVSARAYIAAAGLYELSVNGHKIGNHVLDPAFTRFDRRNLYVTYDVTKALQQGKNVISVLLGNGWYNFQPYTTWFFDSAPWRERPCFCLDLRITYSDGSVQTVSTDGSWQTAFSPIIYNSIYTGEYVDATKAIGGWQPVTVVHAPSEHIVAQAMYPIRDGEQLPAVSLKKINDSDYVFDIGRNIAGVSQITLKGERGMVLHLKHGERLDSSCHVDQSSLDYFLDPKDAPFQTDVYTLKGGNAETFRPRFSYKGFRYVEVTSSKAVALAKTNLAAFFEHSDVPVAGTIHSSNELINQIWQATNASYLSNLFGYPTDCPQREKNGWTGDAHFAIETGLYNFDAITVYEKWLADIRDAQQPNGTLPAIVPTSDWGYDHHNTLDWESGLVLIPWELYRFYGDSKALQDNYEAMCRYINHIALKYPDLIVTEGLGDRGSIAAHADIALTSTAYYYADVTILAKTAKLFKREADYQKYLALAKKIKIAFNDRFYNNGIYAHGYQTENSAALYWGLVPAQNKALVAANLAKSVESDSLHFDVGVLGARVILNALSDNGYADVAYRLATKRSYPSWGYWMDQGLTALPEAWDFRTKVSLNHIFLGAVSGWFYQGLGGIFPDEKDPGFHHIVLQPHIPAGLAQFSAVHDSPYGKIVSGWTTHNHEMIYTVTLPPNTTADLELDVHGKVARKTQLESGTYTYIIKN